jgi:hypothetical protein
MKTKITEMEQKHARVVLDVRIVDTARLGTMR